MQRKTDQSISKIHIESIIQSWIDLMKIRQCWLNDTLCKSKLIIDEPEDEDRLAIPLQLIDAAINRALRDDYDSERWDVIISLAKYLKPEDVINSVEMVTKQNVNLNDIPYNPQADPDFMKIKAFIKRYSSDPNPPRTSLVKQAINKQ